MEKYYFFVSIYSFTMTSFKFTKSSFKTIVFVYNNGDFPDGYLIA